MNDDQPSQEAPINAAALTAHLRTRVLGRTLRWLPEVDSTNRLLAEEGGEAAEGLVVLADRQTAGRGRMGRTWFSPAGVNVYLSVLLQPRVSVAWLPTLPLMVGCAVARAVAALAPAVPVRLKWPNDLLVHGRKLGGVLCEVLTTAEHESRVIVGVGCNINLVPAMVPTELAAIVTSLARETGQRFDRSVVVAEWLNQLETAYAVWCEQGLAPFLPEWAALDALHGRWVRVEQLGQPPAEGVAEGVDSDGLLRLRQPDGSRRLVCSGDAHLV
jgi:BirA family biotin operon repressor/biotin-[acetyl-CoA-carboxylase] ligase